MSVCRWVCTHTCEHAYGGSFPPYFFDTVSHWNRRFINSTRLDNELQRYAFFKTPSGALYADAGASEVTFMQAPIATKPPPCVLKQGLTSLGHITQKRMADLGGRDLPVSVATLSGFLLCGFWVLNFVLMFELQAFYWLSSLATWGSVSQCVSVFIFIARPEAVWAQTEIWNGWGLIEESKLKTIIAGPKAKF